MVARLVALCILTDKTIDVFHISTAYFGFSREKLINLRCKLVFATMQFIETGNILWHVETVVERVGFGKMRGRIKPVEGSKIFFHDCDLRMYSR